jgi:hypothetical protein
VDAGGGRHARGRKGARVGCARSEEDRERHIAKKAFAALAKMRTEMAAARRAEQKAIGKGHRLRVS